VENQVAEPGTNIEHFTVEIIRPVRRRALWSRGATPKGGTLTANKIRRVRWVRST
jgi:hypothetical protein